MKTGAIRPSDAPIRGILLMCLAMACFVTMNTLIKSMRGELPVVELVWGRYFFHALLILVLFPRRIPTLLDSADKGLQLLRSLLVLLATVLMFTSVGLMPIADVVAITFVAPLLIVVVASNRASERQNMNYSVGFIDGCNVDTKWTISCTCRRIRERGGD